MILPAIRIGGHYLVGNDRRLHLKLELPECAVEMSVSSVRYEGLEEDQLESGYLIGARITDMSDADRGHFEEYLAKLVTKHVAT